MKNNKTIHRIGAILAIFAVAFVSGFFINDFARDNDSSAEPEIIATSSQDSLDTTTIKELASSVENSKTDLLNSGLSEEVDSSQPVTGSLVSKKWYQNIDINAPLPQTPKYVDHDLLNVVKAGDIVFDPDGFFGLTGHILIVEGKFTDPVGNEYIRTIEANGYASGLKAVTGVWRSCLDDDFMDANNLIIFRVPNATDVQRQGAVDFAIKQLGKPYTFEYLHPISGVPFAVDTPKWYCSQLGWASYVSQGIDINGTDSEHKYSVVTPREISIHSKFVEKVNV
jgi:hypothetical protein